MIISNRLYYFDRPAEFSNPLFSIESWGGKCPNNASYGIYPLSYHYFVTKTSPVQE